MHEYMTRVYTNTRFTTQSKLYMYLLYLYMVYIWYDRVKIMHIIHIFYYNPGSLTIYTLYIERVLKKCYNKLYSTRITKIAHMAIFNLLIDYLRRIHCIYADIDRVDYLSIVLAAVPYTRWLGMKRWGWFVYIYIFFRSSTLLPSCRISSGKN